MICGTEKFLWYECPRRFVEEIVPEDSCDVYSYGNAY